jgi:Toxin YafO, type II toxin-antitoxin system
MRVFYTHEMVQAAEADLRVKQTLKDFVVYKETGEEGETFGRDAKFRRPTGIELDDIRHVHLLYGYDKKALRVLALKDPYYRTSDSFLIYCVGYASKDCLVIDIIWDDAHQKTENIERMKRYMKIAENFRKSH